MATQLSAPFLSTRTRGAIVEAARTCFKDKGYRNTTVDDVAREANVARSTFYRHYQGLGEVLVQIAEFEIRAAFDQAHRTAMAADGFAARLGEIILYFASGSRSWLSDFGLEDDMMATTNLIHAVSPDFITQISDVLDPVIDEGRRSGALRDDLIATEIVEWLLWNIWSLRYTPRRRQTSLSVRDYIEKLIVPAVLSQKEALRK